MPTYVLTEEQKRELRRKYIENVRTANQYLSNGNKIKLDMDAFDKKLNDPKMQRLYLKGQELYHKYLEKQRISGEIFESMSGEKIPGKTYDLNRLIHSEIIPSDDPEARAYNEQKIRNYILHPEAETERRYRELLNLDISDVAKFSSSEDLKNFFIDFYEKNAAAIDLANETKLILSHCNPKTPALEQYVKQIGANFEVLANIQDIATSIKGEEFFTFPDSLTEEQYEELFGSSNYLIEQGDVAEANKTKITHSMAMEPIEKDFKNFFATCRQNNIDFSNGASLCGLVATDTTTGNRIQFTRYASIEAWKREHPDREQNLVRRDSVVDIDLNIDTLEPTILSAEEVNQIKQITTVDHTLEEGYANPEMPEKFKEPVIERAKRDVLYNYALDNNLNLGDIAHKGIYGVADSYKGNWKERFFNTTSHQYKNFKENLKNFENPNNASYNRPQPVADSARNYLAHKGVTTVEEARRLPPPSDKRALLCLSVIKTFDEQYGLTHRPEVQQQQNEVENNNIVPEVQQQQQNEVENNNNIVREQAIQNPHEVDDLFNDDESVDNDMNLSMDDAAEKKEYDIKK